jgi:peroxiredoxin
MKMKNLKKKILGGLGILLLFGVFAWLLASPQEKVKKGDALQALSLSNIHGSAVSVPSANAKWVHLQFRRFAGCPICNVHMHSLIERNSEILAAGIKEVVVFNSSKEALLPYQGKFPFDVIADLEKKLYTQFGVDESIFSILDVRAWPAMAKGNSTEDRPKGDPEGSPLGRPAEFLIDASGKVVASHYGRHAFDQWSVDELLSLVK